MSMFKGAWDDLTSYRKVLRAIKKHKKSPEWEHLGLKVDWIGRIHKVVNLPKEYEGDDIRIRDSLAVDMSVRYGDYLRDTLKIGDNVFQAAENKTKRSYLFVWSPMFSYWSVGKVLLWIVTILGISFVLSAAWPLISSLILHIPNGVV